MSKEELKISEDKNSQSEREYLKQKDRILNLLRDKHIEKTRPMSYGKTIERNRISTILEKNKAEREGLKNKALEQDIELKNKTLATLFWFLKVETFVIFCFTWFQATEWLGFELEEWSFNLFVGATIMQITAMLLIAVQHLFPKK